MDRQMLKILLISYCNYELDIFAINDNISDIMILQVFFLTIVFTNKKF